MHLVVPANLSALKVDDQILSQWEGVNLQEIKEEGDSCPESKKYLNHLLNTFATKDKRKLRYKEVYQQNHMRNIGRKGCGTYWTYLADVDTIPKSGMADMIQQFYVDLKTENKLCSKWVFFYFTVLIFRKTYYSNFKLIRQGLCFRCAYIIPAFELKDTFSFPETKAEISELFKKGAARQYNLKVYAPAQAPTDYNRYVKK